MIIRILYIFYCLQRFGRDRNSIINITEICYQKYYIYICISEYGIVSEDFENYSELSKLHPCFGIVRNIKCERVTSDEIF